jgi:NAD(P)-dependent dehydrogenase (short-subunit alcohol dehydrogenase family)
MKSPGLLFTAGAGLGYLAIRRWLRPPAIHLPGKVVLITGGSRGLGLALAREFGKRGASIAICARDHGELERAVADLGYRGIAAKAFVCDVSDRAGVAAAVTEVVQAMGPIDVLVNNAGIITVGPFVEMELDDFHRAMDVMFWGPLHTTLAVLPSMRTRQEGSIVNITSIGGKVSVPHLLPYCCAKFAAVALSEGLRSELAAEGIRITTVAPGLLRTGSHLKAEFKGEAQKEYGWFAAGAASALVSISAERAARSVVDAVVRGTSETILSLPADVLARLHGFSPGLAGGLMEIASRFLPSGNGSSELRGGQELERSFNSSVWKTMTWPGRRAASELNEVAP